MMNEGSRQIRLQEIKGTDTGYRYVDGSPVLVGDHLKLNCTERPGTIRARVTKNGSVSYFITFWEGGSRHVGLGDYVPDKFVKFDRPIQGVKAVKPRLFPKYGCKVILGLLDYDHAIMV